MKSTDIRTAEKVSKLFDDGTTWETEQGETLEEMCLVWEADICRKRGMIRYLFKDGSAIVDFGAYWDVEGPLPFSSEGAGETILMNPETGTVQSESDWHYDFESMTPEQWGADTFEGVTLVKVRKDENGKWVGN